MAMLAAAAMVDENVVGIISIVTIFVVFPIVLAYSRLIWKRSAGPPATRSQLPDDTAQRVVQIQQSIDAMALEIERISEGQRFVTKLLAERPRDAAKLEQGLKQQ
jgi:hypothetical protein